MVLVDEVVVEVELVVEVVVVLVVLVELVVVLVLVEVVLVGGTTGVHAAATREAANMATAAMPSRWRRGFCPAVTQGLAGVDSTCCA